MHKVSTFFFALFKITLKNYVYEDTMIVYKDDFLSLA